MLIKVEDIRTPFVRSDGPKPKSRDISWLCIDAAVYSWCMMSREDVSDQLREGADHCILELLTAEDEPVEMELDEVCLLTVHDPVQITALFNTRAYICNEKGDTVEKVVPRRKVKVDLKRGEFDWRSAEACNVKYYRCLKCGNKHRKSGTCPDCGAEPPAQSRVWPQEPCICCGEPADRMMLQMADGTWEWVGTVHHGACGYRVWEMPEPRPPGVASSLGTKFTVAGMEDFGKLLAPPCLKCGKKAARLLKGGKFIGTHCEDCGEQFLKDWDAPRMPR